ncbi:class I SAM-dependent methyltransferase [Thermosulfuriphilus sp.]
MELKDKRRWLKDFVFGFAPTFIIATAAELNLFFLLKEPLSLEEASQKSALPVRSLRMLLNALCALGFLEKNKGKYRLREDLRPFLGREDIFSYEAYLIHGLTLARSWVRLKEAVCGQQGHSQEKDKGPGFFIRLTKGLLAANWPEAEKLADLIKTPCEKILDVGAGSCLWSAPLIKDRPETRVWAIDFPQVLEQSAEPILKKLGLRERFIFLPGNYWEIPWGDGYDLIIFGHICHALGPEENIALFKKAQRALKPQGMLAIVEFIPDEEKNGPLFPLIFALNMLLHTDSGDTYTVSEYEAFLDQAGLKISQTFDLDEGHGSQVILAGLA